MQILYLTKRLNVPKNTYSQNTKLNKKKGKMFIFNLIADLMYNKINLTIRMNLKCSKWMDNLAAGQVNKLLN